jgi:uncharacterized delta-60 repeat protein
LASSAFLLECVGDPGATPPVVEAGTDTGQPPVDSGKDVVAVPDGGSDAKSDAPPPCIIPDSGAPGSLDPSFATAVNAFTNGFKPIDITVDGTGRVYIAGGASACVGGGTGVDFGLVRLTAGGAIDTTFNPLNKPVCVNFDSVDQAYAVRIDPDGNIVVAGLAGNANANKFFAGVARITPAGVLDATFGSGGKVDVLGVDAGVQAATGTGFVVAFDIAFDAATKKIWLVGGDDNGGGVGPTKGYIARLNTGGTVDVGFAGGVLADPSVDAFFAAADDGAGGVYAAGQTRTNPRRMIVKHFDVTGKADGAFGADGGTTIPTADASTGDRARSMVRLADGRLVVAGSSYGSATGPYGAEGPVAVARLTANGTPDPTFGAGALVPIPKLAFNNFFMTHMLGQLCDGTVLLAGRLDVVVNTNQDLALVKLDPSGAPQPSFGTAGIASLSLAGNQSPIGAAQDPKSGKIVVVGGTQTGGEVVAVRFNP